MKTIIFKIRVIAMVLCAIIALSACASGTGYSSDNHTSAPGSMGYSSATPRSASTRRPSGTPRPTASPRPSNTPGPTRRPAATPEASDPYDVHDYSHPDDFYYDHYDDFYDYEDAEDYFDEYGG